MFGEHDARDDRVVAGREELEPPVIAQVARRPPERGSLALVGNHLGGARLAGDVFAVDA